MSISNTDSKVIYTCDPATTTFPYAFKIFEDSDLVVTKYTIDDGTETVLTINTHYTVTGAGDDAGGTVELVAAFSADYKLVIQRVLPLTQTTDYVENDPFPAESHEDALDKLTMICQQLQEQVTRSILQDVTGTVTITIPAPDADKILGWNSGGTALENKDGLDAAIAAAEAAQTAAELAQTGAETAETNAETAETNAETAETNAETAETNAEAAQLAAEAAQAAAEAAVASVDLPVIAAGDGAKLLQVKSDVSGYELKTMAQVVDINGQTEKTSLHADDLFLIEDSQASNVKKKVKRSNVYAAIALGAWASKNNNETYQATTDGFVLGHSGANGTDPSIATDASTPPSVVRSSDATAASNTTTMTPVKSGDYWKATGCTAWLFWIPLS